MFPDVPSLCVYNDALSDIVSSSINDIQLRFTNVCLGVMACELCVRILQILSVVLEYFIDHSSVGFCIVSPTSREARLDFQIECRSLMKILIGQWQTSEELSAASHIEWEVRQSEWDD